MTDKKGHHLRRGAITSTSVETGTAKLFVKKKHKEKTHKAQLFKCANDTIDLELLESKRKSDSCQECMHKWDHLTV